jgi:hypothetical protein
MISDPPRSCNLADKPIPQFGMKRGFFALISLLNLSTISLDVYCFAMSLSSY